MIINVYKEHLIERVEIKNNHTDAHNLMVQKTYITETNDLFFVVDDNGGDDDDEQGDCISLYMIDLD